MTDTEAISRKAIKEERNARMEYEARYRSAVAEAQQEARRRIEVENALRRLVNAHPLFEPAEYTDALIHARDVLLPLPALSADDERKTAR